MKAHLRDRRRLAKFKAEQRTKRRQQPSPSEAPDDDADDAPVRGAQWAGLTWEQARQAQALLERANRERGRLRGPRYALRIAGIRRAVLSGVVGDSALGYRLLACRGGRAMKLHGPHILKENQPKAVRAAVIARRQRETAAAFERNPARRVPPLVSDRSRSFIGRRPPSSLFSPSGLTF